MDVVLRTETPEGIEVVLFAIVYAKILEQHAAVADLGGDRQDHPRARQTTTGPATRARAVLPP
jgi:hypothetical protein